MSKSVRVRTAQRSRHDDNFRQIGRQQTAREDIVSAEQAKKIDEFVANSEKMIKGLQEGLNAFRSEIPTIKAFLQGKQESIDDLDQLTEKCNSLEAENRRLSTDKQTLEEEIEKLHRTIEKKNESFIRISSELKQTKSELDKTKTRLSEVLGNKLTDNNAAIADLSDKNRPSKLAEKWSEIYDNEWTDAYEAVQKLTHHSEEECATILLRLLKMVNRFCLEKWQSYVTEYQKVITRGKDIRIPDYLHKQLKDVAKVLASNMHEDIFQEFLDERVPNVSEENRPLIEPSKVKSYLKACVDLCWLMAAQDPPVVFKMDFKAGEEFDQNTFRAFTKNGSRLKFVVWPPLFLQDGGALLGKGVAQGSEDKRPNTAPAKLHESSEKQPKTVFSSTYTTSLKQACTNERGIIAKSKTSDSQNITLSEFKFRLQISRQPIDLMPEIPSRSSIRWKHARTPSQGEIDTFLWFVSGRYPESQIKAQMGLDVFEMCRDYDDSCKILLKLI